jgi:hypothetical protein
MSALFDEGSEVRRAATKGSGERANNETNRTLRTGETSPKQATLVIGSPKRGDHKNPKKFPTFLATRRKCPFQGHADRCEDAGEK